MKRTPKKHARARSATSLQRKTVKLKVPRQDSHRIEQVPPEQLTVDAIARNHAEFERQFEKNGGYKEYVVQAIGALLAVINRCRDVMEANDPVNAREIFGEPKERLCER